MKSKQMDVGGEKQASGGFAQLRDLLNGSACLPHVRDPGLSLSARLAGRRVLLLMLARERAACLRVSVVADGTISQSGARQINSRAGAELVRVLREEAARHRCDHVVVCMGCGWVAFHGTRRVGAGETYEATLSAALLLREDPGACLVRVDPDYLYSAVDVPCGAGSLVFGLRRQELATLAEEIQQAGLTLVSVKLGVAAALEVWLADPRGDEEACPVVVSDGLGVLLVAENGGGPVVENASSQWAQLRPRQYSNRPGDLAEDLQRLWCEHKGPVPGYVGPAETDPAGLSGGELQPERTLHVEIPELVFSPHSVSEFHPEIAACRPALSPKARGLTWGACALIGLGVVCVVTLLSLSWRTDARSDDLQREQSLVLLEDSKLKASLASLEAQERSAESHLIWLGTHADFQAILLRLLEDIPELVALNRLRCEADDSGRQLTLEFVLEGDEPGCSQAMRSMETGLLGLGFRIGDRSSPVRSGAASTHRWRMIRVLSGEGKL